MPESAELAILLTLQDSATPQLQEFQKTVATTTAEVKSSTTTISEHSTAIRQLGMGLNYLGATALSAGIALAQTKNSTAQAVGQMLVFSGAIMASVGSAIQLVSSVGRIVRALQELAVMQTIVNALSGPLGWIVIIAAIGAAALAFVGLSASAKAATDEIVGDTEKVKKVMDSMNASLDDTRIKQIAYDELAAKVNKSANEIKIMTELAQELNGVLDTTTKVVKGITFKWTPEGWMTLGVATPTGWSLSASANQAGLLADSFGDLDTSVQDAVSAMEDFAATMQAGNYYISTMSGLPGYQLGGIVPGPIGQPVPIIAHGGEAFGSSVGGGNVNVVLNIAGHVQTESDLKVMVRQLFLDIVRRKGLPAGVTGVF